MNITINTDKNKNAKHFDAENNIDNSDTMSVGISGNKENKSQKKTILHSKPESVEINDESSIKIPEGIDQESNDSEKIFSKNINEPSGFTQNVINGALSEGSFNVNAQSNKQAFYNVVDNMSEEASKRLIKRNTKVLSGEERQEVLKSLTTSVKNLIKFLEKSKNDETDSDEFKEVHRTAKALFQKISVGNDENIIVPSSIMGELDALYDSCSSYNSKNRGYRWTRKGAKRQKNINEMLNFLNWNMKKFQFLRKNEDLELKDSFKDNPVDRLLSNGIKIPAYIEFMKEDDEDKEHYSLDNTKEEVKEIAKLLNMPVNERAKYSDKQIVSLTIMQSRNLTHIFLNEKEAGQKKESGKYLDIKDSVYRIERLLSQEKGFDAVNSIEELFGAYQTAIAQCKDYINTNANETDEDKLNVRRMQDTLFRLEMEKRNIDIAKRLIIEDKTEGIAITKPMDLFMLAGIHQMQEDTLVNEATEQDTVAAYSLTLGDFHRLAGTEERGEISFENGKIVVKNKSYLEQTEIYEMYSMLLGEDTKPTVANRQMYERLYQLLDEHLATNNSVEKKEFLKEIRDDLGLNRGENKSFPVSRRYINRIVKRAGFIRYAAQKDFQATNQKRSEEERKAFNVGMMCGMMARRTFNLGARGFMGDETIFYDPSKSQKKELKAIVDGLFTIAKRNGVTIPKMSTHRMDNIINGNITYCVDEVFYSYRRISSYIKNFQNGQDKDNNAFEHFLASDRNIQGKVATLAMLKFSAETEVEKALRSFELDEYLKELAIRFVEETSPNLLENMSKANVYTLSAESSSTIDSIIEKKIPNVRAWQNKDRIKSVRKGTALIKSLCDKFAEYSTLQNRALTEGANTEEINKILALGEQIQNSVYNEEEFALMEMVAKELTGTFYEAGFKDLKKRINENFSFKDSTVQFVNVLKKKDEKESAEAPVKKQEVFSAEDKISMLEGQAKLLTGVLRQEISPSDLLNEKDASIPGQIMELKSILRSFTPGKVVYKDINIAGVKGRLIQKKDNTMYFMVEKHVIPLTNTAFKLADTIEEDLIAHTDKYGESFVESLLNTLEVSEENQGSLIRSRNLCIKYLANKTKQPETFFTNVSSKQLKGFAMSLSQGMLTAKSIVDHISTVESKMYVNGQETRELLSNIDRLHDNTDVIMEKKKEEKQLENDWKPEQKQVLNLFSEMLFSNNSWEMDEQQEKKTQDPGVRIRKVFLANLDGLVTMLLDKESLSNIIDELPLGSVEEGSQEKQHIAEMKKQMLNGINELLDNNEQLKLVRSKFSNSFGWRGMLKYSIKGMLENPKEYPEFNQMIGKLEKIMDKVASANMEGLQGVMAGAAEAVFNAQGDGGIDFSPKLKPDMTANQIKREKIRASNERLEYIIKNAARSAEGQGLFIKNILSNYFVKSSDMDKRAMLASAIRNAKRKPVIPEGASKEDIDKLQKIAQGNFLGGMLKGAGPLLQKILQGLPTEAIPEELQAALEDMKSNLAPIPEKIVKAQMQNIVARSKGKITSIKVNKALGAASVGQTFFCTIKGPEMGENGKDVVVKLLRPDVANRMKREKEIMLWCAKKTDGNIDEEGKEKLNHPKGGMEATYEGQLLRIEEELDLTIESKNAKRGSLYDRGFKSVKSMKVDNVVEATTNSLVLEMAPGTTVDSYLKDVKEKYETFVAKLNMNKGEDDELFVSLSSKNANSILDVREQLTNELNRLQKRQKHLANLVQTWVTEGIYGEGVYHGDLHSGNIMITDDGVTVIDFGNATQLNEEQMTHVTRMMMAAALGDTNIFEESFRALSKKIPKERYEKNRKQLKSLIKEIFSMGNQKSAGQRIAAVLIKAQNMGLELPPEIFNFSQSQLRLQNTLMDINSQISKYKALLEQTYNCTMNPGIDGYDAYISYIAPLNQNAVLQQAPHFIYQMNIMEKDEVTQYVKELDMRSFIDRYMGSDDIVKGYIQRKETEKTVDNEVALRPSFIFYNSLRKLKEAYDNKANNIEELENSFHEDYKKYKEHLILNTNRYTDFFSKDVRDQIKYFVEDEKKIRAHMKAWEEDEKIPQRIRDDLKNKFEALMKELKQGNPLTIKGRKSIKAKEDEYILAYIPAMIERLKETIRVAKNDANTESPDSFVDIMGSIISNNIKSSIRKLGRWNAFINKDKLESRD